MISYAKTPQSREESTRVRCGAPPSLRVPRLTPDHRICEGLTPIALTYTGGGATGVV